MKQNFLLPVKNLLCRAFGAAHLQQVLEQTGLEKADIDAIIAVKEDATDFKPDDYVNKVSTGYENKLLNSPEFLGKITPEKVPDSIKKSIEAGQYGRFMNEFKSLAKNKGIDFSDLSEDDQKSLGKFGEKIFAKYEGKMNNPEAVQKLQNELQAALQKNASYETEMPKTLSELEKKVKGEMNDTITKLVGINTLASLKDEKGNSLLMVEPAYVADTIINNVKSKYSVVTDGVNVILMNKENPALKAMDKAGKDITFADAVKEEAKAGKLIREVQQQEDPMYDKGKVKIEVDGKNIISNDIQKKIDAVAALENKK